MTAKRDKASVHRQRPQAERHRSTAAMHKFMPKLLASIVRKAEDERWPMRGPSRHHPDGPTANHALTFSMDYLRGAAQ